MCRLQIADCEVAVGGYGSGRSGRRPVAEQSYAFPIGLVASTLRTLAPGGFTLGQPVRWSWPGGRVAAALRYTVICAASGQLTVWLAYSTDGQITSDPISVLTTRPHYGGMRYWWCCSGCESRVGVLYYPPGAGFWRCRRCHGITYTSSNQAHQLDRLLQRADKLLRRAPARADR